MGNNPAVHCWDREAAVANRIASPAMNRWAIFSRPLARTQPEFVFLQS
jgi:hypothetical protein